MKKAKNIDKIFMSGLDDFVDDPLIVRETYWHELKQQLDKNKKRSGIVLWWPYLSGAAAVILVFLGWLLLQPAVNHPQKAQQPLAAHKLKTHEPAMPSGTTVDPGKLQPQLHRANDAEYLANNTSAAKSAHSAKKVYNKPANTMAEGNITGSGANNKQNNIATINNPEALTISAKMPGIEPGNIIKSVPALIGDMPDGKFKVLANADNYVKIKSTLKTSKPSFKPQFALSVIGSSEFNRAGSAQQTSAGYNFGLIFSVEPIKKFTISTGVSYSSKPYSLPFDDYHTAYKLKYSPDYVQADCRLLDIPINIGYQFYNQHRNKISVGTGLSSYIMMHERYNYEYDTPSPTASTGYTVKNNGKYLFSIMNFEVTYQRQINSKVGISLQPFLKIPLSNIGYSQVKIETAGVAVGLNWNFNSIHQPK